MTLHIYFYHSFANEAFLVTDYDLQNDDSEV